MRCGEAADLEQLRSARRARNLQRIGPTAHQHIRQRSRLRHHDRAGLSRRSDGFTPRSGQEAGEGDALALETGDPPAMRLLWPMMQRRDQLAGGFVSLAARAEAAIDDFLEMIAAGEATHIATAHLISDVATQQHRGDQSDLVNVVALLPATHASPGDLRRRVERVECVGGDAAVALLVRRDAEVAKLELLVFANEDVERRQIAVQRLAAVQNVERAKDAGDLASYESLGLRSFALQPHAKIAVDGVLECDAVAHAPAVDFDKPIVDAQRARLAEKQIGEVRLAQPTRESLGDLDADLRWQPVLGRRCRQIDLAEPSFADQAVQLIRSSAL